MFKGLWRSVVRWWRSLLGSSPRKAAVVATELPPLTDPDYEYLFMQLLEGVAHGWQQPRVVRFFHKVKQRAPKSQWLAWINSFGYRLVNSPAPNEELARKMIQLSELDCGEVTSLAGEFGHQLLGRIYGNFADEYLPEFAVDELPELDYAAWDDENTLVAAPVAPMPIAVTHEPVGFAESDLDQDETYSQDADDLAEDAPGDLPVFGEVPPELRIAKKPVLGPPPPPGAVNAVAEDVTQPLANAVGGEDLTPPPSPEAIEITEANEAEERVISIEEFAVMLQSDPDLVQEISRQLGIETTDPQLVLDGVIAQMQQQIQDGQ
jgi:hypothetical protein